VECGSSWMWVGGGGWHVDVRDGDGWGGPIDYFDEKYL
jgi:hypothetical protein